MSALIDLPGMLEAAFRDVEDASRAVKEKAYLKSELEHLGVGMPGIRRITKLHAKTVAKEPIDAIVAIAAQLFTSRTFECRVAAVELLTVRKKQLTAEHLPSLERMLRDARTWALVDAIAVTLVGTIFERDPSRVGRVLDAWSLDPDFWIRRTSMLALLPGIRRGEGDFDRFARYADTMLEEKEFFIRKAIGWVLRECAKHRADRVIAFIGPRTHRASGVTMREATRRLPEPARDELMRAYREKRPASAAR